MLLDDVHVLTPEMLRKPSEELAGRSIAGSSSPFWFGLVLHQVAFFPFPCCKHACRWPGHAKFPLGINKCVNVCMHGAL